MNYLSKIILIIFCFLSFLLPANCSEIDECSAFFNQYVKKSNNYSDDLPDLFAPEAVIKRMQIDNSGNRELKTLSKSTYVNKLKKYSSIAKFIGYKNVFSNISFIKEGNKIRISGFRMPTTSKGIKYKVAFLIGKNYNGEWKIFEDYTETRNKL